MIEMTVKTNTLTLTINPYCADCTLPNVCPNSDGVCPSGYQLDPTNPLCCMPVCPPQSCPEGQYWDSVTCACQQIIPTQIQIGNGGIYSISWINNVTIDCTLEGGVNWENSNPLTKTVTVKVTVLDAGGKPVPGVNTNFPAPSNTYGVSTQSITGKLSFITYPQTSSITDENGNAYWELGLSLAITEINGTNFCRLYTPNTSSQTVTVSGIFTEASLPDYSSVDLTVAIPVDITFNITFNPGL